MRRDYEVTLIQPSRPEITGAKVTNDWQLTRPSSLFYLAASLNQYSRWPVRIIDFESKKYHGCSVEQVLSNINSIIFGITSTTYTRFEAIKLAKIIKALHPTALLVVGGVHFMYTAEDTLANIPEVDIVVRGEGEITIVQLTEAIEQKTGLDSVLGITYRRNGQIVRNPDQKIFQDLDGLSVYDNFSWEEYPEYLFGYSEKIPAISIITSRGCPYHCIFCAKAGTKYRLRNPKLVVDEIERLVAQFQVKAINFIDLTLTASANHIQTLCDELISRKVNVLWWCESRVNIPLHLISLMQRAGCVSVAVGVESGSLRMLQKLRKNITPEQVIEFCKECHKYNVNVQCYFMCSLPEETEKDIKETLSLMCQLQEYALCSIQPCMIFPGTEVENIARKKQIISSTFSWCDSYFSQANVDLKQLANIPLYIDRISVKKIKNLLTIWQELKWEKANASRIAEMGFWQLLSKIYDYCIVQRKPLSRYASFSFFKEFLRLKLRVIRKS